MFPDWSFLGSAAGAWWVFWVAVAGLAIFLGPGLFGSGSSRRNTAREELQQRLENGEISREDYERRVRLLGDEPNRSR